MGREGGRRPLPRATTTDQHVTFAREERGGREERMMHAGKESTKNEGGEP